MVAPPKRFYYGWLVVGAASGIEFANAATAIGILTVFVDPMTQEFGWSRTEMAGATSLGAILGAALAPFSGRLVDQLGSRLVLVVGGTMVCLACLYLSLAQTLLGFYIAFTLSRISDQGLIKIGASTTVGKWFLLYRGRATGLVFFAGAAGVIFLAPAVQLIISTWGWRVAWIVFGGLMFLIGLL
ncbi:MAG TPA: MFS transporter, partial [Dehalococcoidia bacterium]|nr:MFS transporter [Dehalococcoidia bacterium]